MREDDCLTDDVVEHFSQAVKLLERIRLIHPNEFGGRHMFGWAKRKIGEQQLSAINDMISTIEHAKQVYSAGAKAGYAPAITAWSEACQFHDALSYAASGLKLSPDRPIAAAQFNELTRRDSQVKKFLKQLSK